MVILDSGVFGEVGFCEVFGVILSVILSGMFVVYVSFMRRCMVENNVKFS